MTDADAQLRDICAEFIGRLYAWEIRHGMEVPSALEDAWGRCETYAQMSPPQSAFQLSDASIHQNLPASPDALDRFAKAVAPWAQNLVQDPLQKKDA